MAEKLLLGSCVCPLCHADTAEVRSDKNGRAYVKCDSCVTMIRTMSHVGDVAMRGMIAKENAPPANDRSPADKPAPAAPDKPAPAAPPKRSGFVDAVRALSGGR